MRRWLLLLGLALIAAGWATTEELAACCYDGHLADWDLA